MSTTKTTLLFDAQTTNANGTVTVRPFGIVPVTYSGTFDSGTITLESSSDNGTTWVTIEDTAKTEASSFLIEPRGLLVRAVTSGGGGSMSVTVSVGSEK